MEGSTIIKTIVEQKCLLTGTKKKYWAQICGYDEKTFSLLINGKKPIRYDDITRLSMGLGVSTNEFFPKHQPTA